MADSLLRSKVTKQPVCVRLKLQINADPGQGQPETPFVTAYFAL